MNQGGTKGDPKNTKGGGGKGYPRGGYGKDPKGGWNMQFNWQQQWQYPTGQTWKYPAQPAQPSYQPPANVHQSQVPPPRGAYTQHDFENDAKLLVYGTAAQKEAAENRIRAQGGAFGTNPQ